MKSEFAKFDIFDAKIFSYQRYKDNEHHFTVETKEDMKPEFVGTITSHLLTIKWWYENTNEEMAAFFEDDCDFSTVAHWNFTFDDFIKKCGPLWDCLQLCVMHETHPIMIPRHRNLWDHGLQAYVMKRHYAKKLIDYYFKDDRTIHLRMPYDLREKQPTRMATSIENMMYGLGVTYIHPLFNHNVNFDTTVHAPDALVHRDVATNSYHFVKDWWENVGSKSTLEQIFDYSSIRQDEFFYYHLIPIDL